MKRELITAATLVVVFACSEQAGQMLIDAGEMMRDAGDADAATMPDGSTGTGGSGVGPAAQVFPVDCSNGGFVLTNVDQGPPGTVTIRQSFPDPWGATDPPRVVDYQSDAIWSIDGKVLVQCNPNVISSTIEIR